MMMAIVIPLLIFPSVEKDAHWSRIFTRRNPAISPRKSDATVLKE